MTFYIYATILPNLLGSHTSLVGSHAGNEQPPGDLTITFLEDIFHIFLSNIASL